MGEHSYEPLQCYARAVTSAQNMRACVEYIPPYDRLQHRALLLVGSLVCACQWVEQRWAAVGEHSYEPS